MQNEKTNMDMAENLRKQAMKAYEDLDVNREYKNLKRNGELITYAKKSYALLKNFNYNIGIIGVQSSGKTSVLNTLLGFPYMPVAGVVTTCAVAHIKYQNKLGIEIQDYKGAHVTIDLNRISEQLFRELKLYACSCVKEYDIEQLDYFMIESHINEDGKRIIKPENLNLSFNNIRHRVMLVLNILLCYVDMNADPKFLKPEVLEIIEWRSKLLPKLGFPKTVKDYTVTFYCDSPILQQGLIFTDLPGLGADVGMGADGMNSHNQITLDEAKKVDAVMFIMTPTMTADDKKPIKDILPIFSGQKVSSAENKLIPIVNKIDMVQGGGYKNKVDELFAECDLNSLNSKNTFDISARRAEKRLFDLNSELLIYNSYCAKSLPDCFRSDDMIRQGMESNYGMSNFDTIYHYILTYLPKAMIVESLQLMLYVYQEMSAVMTVEKAGLDISEQFLRSGTDASVNLMKLLGAAVTKLVNQGGTKQKTASDKILEDLQNNVLSEKARKEIAETFNALILSDHYAMSQDVKKYGKSLMNQENFYGDIVLSRNNGKKMEVENVKNWDNLIARVTGEDYDKSFSYFQREIHNIDEKFIEKIRDADEELTEFMEEFGSDLWQALEKQRKNLILQSAQSVLSSAQQGKLTNSDNYEAAKQVISYLQTNTDETLWSEYKYALSWISQSFDPDSKEAIKNIKSFNISEKEMIKVDTLNMLDFVIKQMKDVYTNAQSTAKTCFDAQNKNIEAERDKFLIDVARRKLAIKNVYNQRNKKFLESIVKKGIIFTKVALVRSCNLSDALDGKLDLSDEDMKKYDTLIDEMLNKLFSNYSGLAADKSQSLFKVWTELNENLGNLTKYISGYVTENEAIFKKKIAQKKSIILAFTLDESIEKWFSGFQDCPDFFEMFSGEVTKIKELHMSLINIQHEVRT